MNDFKKCHGPSRAKSKKGIENVNDTEKKEKFKALQRDLGLTNSKCAKILGIKLNTLERWRMDGEGYPPPMMPAIKLLEILKCVREEDQEFFEELKKQL